MLRWVVRPRGGIAVPRERGAVPAGMHGSSIDRQLGSASETACPIQPVEGLGVQLQFGRGQDLVELGDAARTRDRDERRLAVQQPREHDLVRRGPMRGGDVAERREPGVVGWVLVAAGTDRSG